MKVSVLLRAACAASGDFMQAGLAGSRQASNLAQSVTEAAHRRPVGTAFRCWGAFRPYPVSDLVLSAQRCLLTPDQWTLVEHSQRALVAYRFRNGSGKFWLCSMSVVSHHVVCIDVAMLQPNHSRCSCSGEASLNRNGNDPTDSWGRK